MIKKSEMLNILLVSILVLVMNINSPILNEVVYNISKIYQVNKLEKNTQNLKQLQTKHFIIEFDERDDKDIILIGNEFERYYTILSKDFEYNKQNKILVVIYNNQMNMKEALKLPENSEVIGLYSEGAINILSKQGWEDKKIRENYYVYGPILHELVHYFVDERTEGNYPIWFTEGVAMNYEYIINGVEWGEGKNYNKAYNINELTNSFEYLNQDYAYRTSYNIIKNFVKQNEMKNLFIVMSNFSKGYVDKDLDKTFSQYIEL